MKKLISKILILCLLLCLTACGSKNNTGDNMDTTEANQASNQEQAESIEAISPTDPAYWTYQGSDRTGYIMVPYNWTEEEYEYEFEGNYSLMLISPERNAMVSLIENNYGYDPKQYDSQEPAEYIMEAYVAQYESQGAEHIGAETVDINGYTFYKSTDCYPSGVYADYDYYLYTYVTFSGERFYTIVVEGNQDSMTDVLVKVEESFTESK